MNDRRLWLRMLALGWLGSALTLVIFMLFYPEGGIYVGFWLACIHSYLALATVLDPIGDKSSRGFGLVSGALNGAVGLGLLVGFLFYSDLQGGDGLAGLIVLLGGAAAALLGAALGGAIGFRTASSPAAYRAMHVPVLVVAGILDYLALSEVEGGYFYFAIFPVILFGPLLVTLLRATTNVVEVSSDPWARVRAEVQRHTNTALEGRKGSLSAATAEKAGELSPPDVDSPP